METSTAIVRLADISKRNSVVRTYYSTYGRTHVERLTRISLGQGRKTLVTVLGIVALYMAELDV